MPAPASRSLPLDLYMHAAAARTGRSRPSYTTLVLAYVVSTGVGTHGSFKPSEVRSWIKEKLGLDVDRRRVHEALTELVRKGVLEKLAQGLYRVKNAAKALAEFAKRLTGQRWAGVRQRAAQTGSPTRVAPVSAGGGCFVAARWHRRTRRGSPLDWLVELFLALGVVEGFARCARRRVRELLRAAGLSGYRLRKLSSWVQELVGRLCSCSIRVGAHGGGDDRFYPWEELVRLALGLERPWQHWREFGVDVVCCNRREEGEDSVEFLRELRKSMGFQMIYVPLNGVGSRR